MGATYNRFSDNQISKKINSGRGEKSSYKPSPIFSTLTDDWMQTFVGLLTLKKERLMTTVPIKPNRRDTCDDLDGLALALPLNFKGELEGVALDLDLELDLSFVGLLTLKKERPRPLCQ
ncbi:hypothetical protein V6259_02500 [Marinomonas sp. TI.3.20]|uniref:hypothetical protein n=1 Tax=Marinomonas sp. TI.3.20 TaxID=3121296 RepID=UPI00311DB1A3